VLPTCKHTLMLAGRLSPDVTRKVWQVDYISFHPLGYSDGQRSMMLSERIHWSIQDQARRSAPTKTLIVISAAVCSQGEVERSRRTHVVQERVS